MISYNLEDAREQLRDLKQNGLPDIFQINSNYARVFAFQGRDGCLIITDNNGNIMNLKDIKSLVSYLEHTIDNLDEDKIIKERIAQLEKEIENYSVPKSKGAVSKKKGFIYLIQGENGRYKIGCSANPKARLSQLKVSSCEDHTLIHTYKVNDMYLEEKKLHEMLKDSRVHSEWFELSEDEILCIKGMSNE